MYETCASASYCCLYFLISDIENILKYSPFPEYNPKYHQLLRLHLWVCVYALYLPTIPVLSIFDYKHYLMHNSVKGRGRPPQNVGSKPKLGIFWKA
jgi:hypothetical protein